MAIYACNDEGINALNTVASAIDNAKDEILELTVNMQSTADEYSGTIGPHEEELTEALQDISESINSASSPVEEISEILRAVADGYEDEISSSLMRGNSGN